MSEKTKVGRPSLLTVEMIARVSDLVPRLVYPGLIADAVGVSRRTFTRWMTLGRRADRRVAKEGGDPTKEEAPYFGLLACFRGKRAELIGDALSSIVAGFRSGEWTCAAWLLERLEPERFGRDRAELKQLRRQVQEFVQQHAAPNGKPAR